LPAKVQKNRIKAKKTQDSYGGCGSIFYDILPVIRIIMRKFAAGKRQEHKVSA
jgi:hypothetical protein